MSTMLELDPVSAGVWHRLLRNYTGKDGGRPLFEPIGRETNISL